MLRTTRLSAVYHWFLFVQCNMAGLSFICLLVPYCLLLVLLLCFPHTDHELAVPQRQGVSDKLDGFQLLHHFVQQLWLIGNTPRKLYVCYTYGNTPRKLYVNYTYGNTPQKLHVDLYKVQAG